MMTWRFMEAEDPTSEDSSTELWADAVDTRIAIQHCLFGGGFNVNEMQGEGDDLVFVDHGHRPTLAAAKALALTVWQRKKELN